MFEGFRPETIDFLWGIRMNNRKDWFEEHKKMYLETLYQPMCQLAEEVYAPFAEGSGMRLHVSRIYRDARYAHGLPYKDSLWFSIRHDVDGYYWTQLPCLYFDLYGEYYSFGYGLVTPRPDAAERFRRRLEEKPEEFLELAAQLRRSDGLEITGESYKRKKPCADPRMEPYYNLKQLLCFHRRPIEPALFEPSLADTVRKTLESVMPLYRYCEKFIYSN